MSFTEVVATLTAAKIPCTVKHYEPKAGYTQFSIEFGTNWPEELMESVDTAFGGNVPEYIGFCGSSSGPNLIAQADVAGGPAIYSGQSNRW